MNPKHLRFFGIRWNTIKIVLIDLFPSRTFLRLRQLAGHRNMLIPPTFFAKESFVHGLAAVAATVAFRPNCQRKLNFSLHINSARNS